MSRQREDEERSCRNSGRFRRRHGRSLTTGSASAPACLRSSVGRAAGFDPARRGSTPLGGSDTVKIVELLPWFARGKRSMLGLPSRSGSG